MELTSILESEREAFALSETTSQSDSQAKKKKLRTAHSTVIGPGGINPAQLSTGQDDSEMIMQYEKRIAEMLMTMQKQERDILYKDEEIKSIKNIARDLAE